LGNVTSFVITEFSLYYAYTDDYNIMSRRKHYSVTVSRMWQNISINNNSRYKCITYKPQNVIILACLLRIFDFWLREITCNMYVPTYTLMMFYTRGFLKYLTGHIRNKNMRTKRLKMYWKISAMLKIFGPRDSNKHKANHELKSLILYLRQYIIWFMSEFSMKLYCVWVYT
jgi:hypothetical protein